MTAIPKAYEPAASESKWYSRWVESGCFLPGSDSDAETYSIVIPPPNVTGVLTMGHVLNNTIQDILIRRARQAGKRALWIPGTDHAGIATQTKVEKELRQEGLTRHDLGREKFVEKACEWRDTHGGIIFEQLKRLGASCAWERNVHTLDEGYKNAVLHTFVELYKRGYIYRGLRMVNWCPASLTALSDEEVIMKPCKSHLYKMRYEIVEEPGQYIEIATTRPETLMGDTAVAVNPEDERYKHLVGKHCWRPFPRAQIPIIADAAVEKDFGTGALKVTPAHDPADFEIGKRHDLPTIEVIDEHGILNENAGEDFVGMDRAKARKVAAKKLEELGLLIATEDHDNNVGFSERADVLVEPRLSEQWFLRYPKVEESKAAVKEAMIRFWPKRWEKTYLHWLNNIQDWCISRQLWWGHRIPVWYRKDADRNDPQNIHVSIEGPIDPENWEQDEDVLDTWFSSWIWPFATMGWPNEEAMQTHELSKFYPTSDLVTGPDIIFFWVSRMIMAGLEFMGPEKETLTPEDIQARMPFKNVYFTGIIRDIQGRKMSKSLGNSPDPLDLIAKYGADGLRFGIMSIAPQGQDILFNEDCVAQGRNFCNKLWNACRFRQMSGEMADNSSIEAIAKRMDAKFFDEDDHAILGQLTQTLDAVNKQLNEYAFSMATQTLYNFFWGDFCDWYLEVSKTKSPEHKATSFAVQDLVIRQLLLMLHPFTPFITEELWHLLGYGPEGSFIQNASPSTAEVLSTALNTCGITLKPEALTTVEKLRECVSKLRAIKAQYNLGAKKDINFFYTADEADHACISAHTEKLKSMAGAASLTRTDDVKEAPASITPLGTFYIDLASAVDIEAEKTRLNKELEKLKGLILSAQKKLENKSFTDKAPEQVIAGVQKQLDENKAKSEEIIKLLGSFTS